MFDETLSIQDFRKITREMKKDQSIFYESLLLAVEQLAEKDSREYYLKGFEPFRPEDVRKIDIESPDEKRRNKLLKRYHSDLQSLQCQGLYAGQPRISTKLHRHLKRQCHTDVTLKDIQQSLSGIGVSLSRRVIEEREK